MIKAHEIQGCIALENSFNKVGLDHVVLVKVASTAVVRQLLGFTREQTINAHFAGVGRRAELCAPIGTRPTRVRAKVWAAGDATSRAVRLALMAQSGEMGYPVGADREDLGLLRCVVPGQRIHVPAPVRQLCDGKRAVQDQLSGRVPRADRGRSGDEAARATCRSGKTLGTSVDHVAHTRPACASSTRKARCPTRPTATTACST